MTIKQLSIFLENKSGRLTEVLETLGKAKINIVAMTIADTSEFGILRMIVSNPDLAYQSLKEKSFSVNLTEVLSIYISSEAGSAARMLHQLSDEGISIEYMYAFNHGPKAVIIMRTDEKQKAIKVIEKHKLEVVRQEDLNQ